MNVNTAYAAGRFGDWRKVREVQAVLRANGYDITYDWTVHAEAGESERDGSMRPEAMRAAALTDLDAAQNARLLVLLCVDDMADALGCYVELGAALAAGRAVDVIAPPRPSIFFALPAVRVFSSADSWAASFPGTVAA
jgi:hypothetical protein